MLAVVDDADGGCYTGETYSPTWSSVCDGERIEYKDTWTERPTKKTWVPISIIRTVYPAEYEI